MKTLTVIVPDDVAQHLDQLGLLESEGGEAWEVVFREALRRYPLASRAPRHGDPLPEGKEAPMAMTIRTEPPSASSGASQQQTEGGGWIEEAMRDLEGIDREVADDGLPEVTEIARKEARRVLEALADGPIAPIVAPTEDGEVSLYFKAPQTRAALYILLSGDGAGAWYSVIRGRDGYGHYANSEELPLDFLRSRLQALMAPTS